MQFPDNKTFHKTVLRWFKQYGRKDLPWQQNPTPYRVWISEIMLQQTQVNTVIPYFERFIKCFPDVKKLARADLDEVLHLWSGLGYYARARNLHKTANIICKEFKGQFPQTVAELANLPGIGLSTAGAILSLASDLPAVILDGNVKRVLARVLTLPEWSGKPQALQQLWEAATHLTPNKQVQQYNQAMMDLGAMVCTRSKPRCDSCPLTDFCLAYKQDAVMKYPISKPRIQIPQRETFLLLLTNQKNEILLIKRPPTGIWGGLWSLPECSAPQTLAKWCQQNLACNIGDIETLPNIEHTFSHFHLTMTPIKAEIKKYPSRVMDNDTQIWYNMSKKQIIGLPAPIQRLLEKVNA